MVTFFVQSAERTETGWLVRGEPGRGAPRVGDHLTFVQHQEPPREDRTTLTVVEVDADSLVLLGGDDVVLGDGDILGTVADRL